MPTPLPPADRRRWTRSPRRMRPSVLVVALVVHLHAQSRRRGALGRTRYEAKAIREGRRCVFLRFVRQ